MNGFTLQFARRFEKAVSAIEHAANYDDKEVTDIIHDSSRVIHILVVNGFNPEQAGLFSIILPNAWNPLMHWYKQKRSVPNTKESV